MKSISRCALLALSFSIPLITLAYGADTPFATRTIKKKPTDRKILYNRLEAMIPCRVRIDEAGNERRRQKKRKKWATFPTVATTKKDSYRHD